VLAEAYAQGVPKILKKEGERPRFVTLPGAIAWGAREGYFLACPGLADEYSGAA